MAASLAEFGWRQPIVVDEAMVKGEREPMGRRPELEDVPLSLRNVEGLLHERGIDVGHETIRFWWHRFGPMLAAEIRRKGAGRMRAFSNWRWHVDEVSVKIGGERSTAKAKVSKPSSPSGATRRRR